ncbi:hypothetical protein HK102_010296, partial [Quaeritorhiza haematococci]
MKKPQTHLHIITSSISVMPTPRVHEKKAWNTVSFHRLPSQPIDSDSLPLHISSQPQPRHATRCNESFPVSTHTFAWFVSFGALIYFTAKELGIIEHYNSRNDPRLTSTPQRFPVEFRTLRFAALSAATMLATAFAPVLIYLTAVSSLRGPLSSLLANVVGVRESRFMCGFDGAVGVLSAVGVLMATLAGIETFTVQGVDVDLYQGTVAAFGLFAFTNLVITNLTWATQKRTSSNSLPTSITELCFRTTNVFLSLAAILSSALLIFTLRTTPHPQTLPPHFHHSFRTLLILFTTTNTLTILGNSTILVSVWLSSCLPYEDVVAVKSKYKPTSTEFRRVVGATAALVS